jgi:hypothetical protein
MSGKVRSDGSERERGRVACVGSTATLIRQTENSRMAGRGYGQNHATNAPGRRLYDQVAQHAGFIIYDHEL